MCIDFWFVGVSNKILCVRDERRQQQKKQLTTCIAISCCEWSTNVWIYDKRKKNKNKKTFERRNRITENKEESKIDKTIKNKTKMCTIKRKWIDNEQQCTYCILLTTLYRRLWDKQLYSWILRKKNQQQKKRQHNNKKSISDYNAWCLRFWMLINTMWMVWKRKKPTKTIQYDILIFFSTSVHLYTGNFSTLMPILISIETTTAIMIIISRRNETARAILQSKCRLLQIYCKIFCSFGSIKKLIISIMSTVVIAMYTQRSS